MSPTPSIVTVRPVELATGMTGALGVGLDGELEQLPCTTTIRMKARAAAA